MPPPRGRLRVRPRSFVAAGAADSPAQPVVLAPAILHASSPSPSLFSSHLYPTPHPLDCQDLKKEVDEGERFAWKVCRRLCLITAAIQLARLILSPGWTADRPEGILRPILTRPI